ncbi:hypothetical protein [Corynebacterium glutamicum]|uniref:hypothetical protein n=1 Tax=Corynebacterium glutamicum TaxID=1718 RepID=UPI0009422807|nr:hypothetical protein [Corynebacterium glutamicum]OKX80521.1 hypothetical protein AUO95_10265 [Corynebacterium glutamicum]
MDDDDPFWGPDGLLWVACPANDMSQSVGFSSYAEAIFYASDRSAADRRAKLVEQDRREAERILRSWIESKTGVSDFDRFTWKASLLMGYLGDVLRKELAPIFDIAKKVFSEKEEDDG